MNPELEEQCQAQPARCGGPISALERPGVAQEAETAPASLQRALAYCHVALQSNNRGLRPVRAKAGYCVVVVLPSRGRR